MNKDAIYDSLPLSPTDLLPAPKPSIIPLPFTWRCHLCRRTQRLSLGPRCLHCSHTRCSPAAPPDHPMAKKAVLPPRRSGNGRVFKRKKHGPQRRQTRFCKTSFDYDAWRAHNVFRRAMHTFDSDPAGYGTTYGAWMHKWEEGDIMDKFEVEDEWKASLRKDEDSRLDRMKRVDGMCEMDCDYPAECLRVRAHAHDHPDEEQVEDRAGDTSNEADGEQACSAEEAKEGDEDEEGPVGNEEGSDEDQDVDVPDEDNEGPDEDEGPFEDEESPDDDEECPSPDV